MPTTRSAVLIDEFEWNQHPVWQRKRLHQIPRMGDANQISATTHSPYSRDAVIDLGALGEAAGRGAERRQPHAVEILVATRVERRQEIGTSEFRARKIYLDVFAPALYQPASSTFARERVRKEVVSRLVRGVDF